MNKSIDLIWVEGHGLLDIIIEFLEEDWFGGLSGFGGVPHYNL